MGTFLVAVTRVVAEQPLPAGVASLGSTVVSLLNAADSSVAQTQTITDGSLLTSFAGVTEGAYIVSAQDLDNTGANLGTAVTQTVTVSDAPPVPVTFLASTSLSVTVTPEAAPAADAAAPIPAAS
jgi:CBS-domain-containing membrane protein